MGAGGGQRTDRQKVLFYITQINNFIFLNYLLQGSFLRTDFSFKVYYPATREVQDSQVRDSLDRSSSSFPTTQTTDSLPQPTPFTHTLDAYFPEATQS